MIEFDKRIINPKLIFTPSECRNEYIAKRLQEPVYFTNSFDDFADLSKCKMGFLEYINDKNPNPYTIVRYNRARESFECKYIVFEKNVKTLLTGNNFDTVIIDEVPNHYQIDPVELLAKVRDLIRFNTVIYNGRRATYDVHCARVLLSIKQIADSVLKLKQ